MLGDSQIFIQAVTNKQQCDLSLLPAKKAIGKHRLQTRIQRALSSHLIETTQEVSLLCLQPCYESQRL
jgi:hypothetical protein